MNLATNTYSHCLISNIKKKAEDDWHTQCEYPAKMGGYSIKIEGVEFKAKVVDLDCSEYSNGSALETSPIMVQGYQAFEYS